MRLHGTHPISGEWNVREQNICSGMKAADGKGSVSKILIGMVATANIVKIGDTANPLCASLEL